MNMKVKQSEVKVSTVEKLKKSYERLIDRYKKISEEDSFLPKAKKN